MTPWRGGHLGGTNLPCIQGLGKFLVCSFQPWPVFFSCQDLDVSKNRGTQNGVQNGWFISWKTLLKWIWGVPLFLETPILRFANFIFIGVDATLLCILNCVFFIYLRMVLGMPTTMAGSHHQRPRTYISRSQKFIFTFHDCILGAAAFSNMGHTWDWINASGPFSSWTMRGHILDNFEGVVFLGFLPDLPWLNLSIQIIIFHQPRFPWNSRGPISLPKRYLLGEIGRVRSL